MKSTLPLRLESTSPYAIVAEVLHKTPAAEVLRLIEGGSYYETMGVRCEAQLAGTTEDELRPQLDDAALATLARIVRSTRA